MDSTQVQDRAQVAEATESGLSKFLVHKQLDVISSI